MSELSVLKNAIENIISSYEDRLRNLDSIFDVTYSFLSKTQETLVNAREEREKLNSQIRDILARGEHLRRKDFDIMMQEILTTQDKREMDVSVLLKEYFNDQKEMARNLRENLEEIRDSLARGETKKIKIFQALIKDILSKQEKRKEEIISGLKNFQNQQRDLAIRLKNLLKRGNDLRIRDLKSMLNEFKARGKEMLNLRSFSSPKAIRPAEKGIKIDVCNQPKVVEGCLYKNERRV